MARTAAIAFAALLLVIPGCLGDDGGSAPPTSGTGPTAPTNGQSPEGSVNETSLLVQANAEFGVALLRELMNATPGENAFVSPLSASVALAMAHAGARGETREAMARALRFEGMDARAIDQEHRALLESLAWSEPDLTLQVADAAWADERFHPSPDYVAKLETDYHSAFFVEDFEDPSTVDDVNGWVSERTRGKIPRLIDQILPDEVMLLVNTVYFKGAWAAPFRADCTRDAPFTREDGTSATVRMMCGARVGPATWSESDVGTVVRLPYNESRFAMYVLLPAEGEALDEVVARLDGPTLTAAFGATRDGNVEVEMPRFRMRTELDLAPPLTALGMGIAFTDRADFTGIAEGLYISRVKQVALIEVDENGTEAAAATVVGVGATSAPPPPTRVVVDRPYLSILRDDGTGAILFVGAIRDPSA